MVSYGCCGQINPFEEKDEEEKIIKRININPVYKINSVPITESSYAILIPFAGIVSSSIIGIYLALKRS